jgi:hypothetical protein
MLKRINVPTLPPSRRVISRSISVIEPTRGYSCACARSTVRPCMPHAAWRRAAIRAVSSPVSWPVDTPPAATRGELELSSARSERSHHVRRETGRLRRAREIHRGHVLHMRGNASVERLRLRDRLQEVREQDRLTARLHGQAMVGLESGQRHVRLGVVPRPRAGCCRASSRVPR